MKYMPIDRINCMEIILQEFPAFRPRWEEHVDSWSPVIDRPVALDIAEFSDFALELIQTGTEIELDRLASTIEQILIEGDSIVNYTFRMMFLKNLASQSETTGIPVDRFIAKLQPITIYYCKALDIFWGEDIPMVVPEAETAVDD
jgi:hypothetical protein